LYLSICCSIYVYFEDIVPGVILKRREELIPVIVCSISQHPDPNNRYTLTQLLFNLIKKPNESERKILVEGFETLAKIIGEESTERELLPQCWEQIHDEHDERRVLVADSCGAIAKYIRAELRPSLLLSILQQLLTDKSHIVRQAVSYCVFLTLCNRIMSITYTIQTVI
jgi:hypothetical protein